MYNGQERLHDPSYQGLDKVFNQQPCRVNNKGPDHSLNDKSVKKRNDVKGDKADVLFLFP